MDKLITSGSPNFESEGSEHDDGWPKTDIIIKTIKTIWRILGFKTWRISPLSFT
jgi:hypothetical protein